MALFRKSEPVTLGIDISSTSVKVLELSAKDSTYRVENYAVVPLAPGIVVEKVVKDSEALSETIGSAIKRIKTSIKHAAVAVPDSSVITKTLQIDASLSEEDIEMQVMIEADKHIPFPLEEVSLDFDVLGPSLVANNMSDVLLVASRSENVDTRVSAMLGAGLIPQTVDVESYAMERACSLIQHQFPNQGKEEAIAIIDIGSIMTSLTVLYNSTTIFTREEVFGGEQLTRAIQRHYGLSYAEAGLAKKKGGLPDDYQTDVLGPFKESAVLQIRRALQFFFSASQHSSINQIILAGGSVTLPDFPELIEEQIGISTTVANPFADMSVAKGVNAEALTRDASALMICCGLAMRSLN